ncbi:3290_t:CDS:1, partial [Gigaspora margarita]
LITVNPVRSEAPPIKKIFDPFTEFRHDVAEILCQEFPQQHSIVVRLF